MMWDSEQNKCFEGMNVVSQDHAQGGNDEMVPETQFQQDPMAL